jgi:predicted PurR-regulated permease PerM
VTRPLAISLVAGVVLVGLVALAWFFGSQLGAEFQGLSARATEVRDWLAQQPLVREVQNFKPDAPIGSLMPQLASWTISVGAALVGSVLVLTGAFYLAINNEPYRAGFLKLVPDDYLASVEATMDDAHEALARWLGGQVVIMLIVGTTTATALWLVGLPSAVALGILAGLSNFVPYIGSIAAAVVMLVVAVAQSWEMVVWVGAVLFVVQQIESNVLQPVLGGGAVELPPAIALYAMAVMGVLFGPLGLLFGFPLAVVIDIAVRRLYVLDTLERPIDILGEKAEKSRAT